MEFAFQDIFPFTYIHIQKSELNVHGKVPLALSVNVISIRFL